MNKNLIIIGGVVAAYLIWKKSTKTETIEEVVIEGEEDGNAQYDVSRENPNKTRSFDGYNYASGAKGTMVKGKGGELFCDCTCSGSTKTFSVNSVAVKGRHKTCNHTCADKAHAYCGSGGGKVKKRTLNSSLGLR